MVTKKAGTVLLNVENRQIALIQNKKTNEFSFPKGHLEKGETLQECAMRETEEETLRKNHLVSNNPIYINRYTTPSKENVKCSFFLAIDDGPTEKEIKEEDMETSKWIDLNDVESTLSYSNLKAMWRKVRRVVFKYLKNNAIK